MLACQSTQFPQRTICRLRGRFNQVQPRKCLYNVGGHALPRHRRGVLSTGGVGDCCEHRSERRSEREEGDHKNGKLLPFNMQQLTSQAQVHQSILSIILQHSFIDCNLSHTPARSRAVDGWAGHDVLQDTLDFSFFSLLVGCC